MIDAATFANLHNAFWHTNTPMCEHFVRRLNLDGLERFEPPMDDSNTSNRALIAEYAFSLFVERTTDYLNNKERRPDQVIEDTAWLATKARLSPYIDQGLVLDRNFDEDQCREIDEISRTLLKFFTNQRRPLVLRPLFSGCGFVDASEGDVIHGETLFEVKTVDRRFRSSDIRQMITYAALNFASEQFDIKKVGLFNPRRGQYCNIDLDYACWEIAGKHSQELFEAVIHTISSGEISR